MSKVEEQILKAMEAGEFANLPGQGKPLPLSTDAFEDPEWALANHILKNAGFTLPWIETRGAIEADLEAARASLLRAWNWKQAAQSKNPSDPIIGPAWKKAEGNFRQQIASLNRQIASYNLQAPHDRFQLRILDAGREIERITGMGIDQEREA